MTQTQLPKQIRIYLSPTVTILNHRNLTLNTLKIYLKRLDSSRTIEKLFDRIVQIRLEETDLGPATKFLPVIKEFHWLATNASKTQAIMICDDDHYYHPYTISTLLEYSNQYKNNIVGLARKETGRLNEILFNVDDTKLCNYDFIFSIYFKRISGNFGTTEKQNVG